MNLQEQVQALIQQAPQDGVMPQAIAALAPALIQVGSQLPHPKYYVLQTLDSGWISSALELKESPGQTKQVIYVYPSLEAARHSPIAVRHPNLLALPMPTLHILFQSLSLKNTDSIIFLSEERAGTGMEIKCQEIRLLFQNALKMNRPEIPPNLA